jgi:hypothetical protein
MVPALAPARFYIVKWAALMIPLLLGGCTAFVMAISVATGLVEFADKVVGLDVSIQQAQQNKVPLKELSP